MTTSSSLGTTHVDQPSLALGPGMTQVAHGIAPDILAIGYSQTIGASELVAAGCAYSISLTFTVG